MNIKATSDEIDMLLNTADKGDFMADRYFIYTIITI